MPLLTLVSPVYRKAPTISVDVRTSDGLTELLPRMYQLNADPLE